MSIIIILLLYLDNTPTPHPRVNCFLIKEEFAKAYLQLNNTIAKYKPHLFVSIMRGSIGLWENVEEVMGDASIGQFRGIQPYTS